MADPFEVQLVATDREVWTGQATLLPSRRMTVRSGLCLATHRCLRCSRTVRF